MFYKLYFSYSESFLSAVAWVLHYFVKQIIIIDNWLSFASGLYFNGQTSIRKTLKPVLGNMYLSYSPHEQNATQGQFLSRV